jgi:hypothetical protein
MIFGTAKPGHFSIAATEGRRKFEQDARDLFKPTRSGRGVPCLASG